ncbi:hypothetical protein F5X99DRAFT_169255 [Biscogniauxia marginata]|nr:hypothetical protein F5X99DRAFT_169255 [Biscogniauxia marginata]
MVPVRKPGRPLSSCPHAPGKHCGCGNVTAAIPRKGKCGCRSAQNPNGVPTKIKIEPPNLDNPPLSPTKGTTFRIQKTASKFLNRKQPYDPSTLERMEPSTFNIMDHQGFPLSIEDEIERTDPMTSQNFVPALPVGFEQSGAFPLQFGDFQPTVSRLDTTMNHSFPPNNSIADLSPTVSSRNDASGRSSFASGTSSAPQHTPTSSSGSFSYELPPEESSSCCSQPSSQPPPQAQSQSQLPAQFQSHMQPQDALDLMGFGLSLPPGGNNIVAQYPQAVGFNQQIYSTHFHQPTIYTYPPSYGTPFQPVQLAHWQQAMAGNSQSTPQSGYTNPRPRMDSNASSTNLLTMHECTCGPGCQCVGCTAHPFNEATQDYVRSAMDSQYVTSPANEEYVKSIAEARNSIPITIPTATLPPVGDGPSPTSETTSSDTVTGPCLEDQTLSPENFFFVQYDVEKMGLGCDGKSNSCPCGDDCACAGCMIHGKDLSEASL